MHSAACVYCSGLTTAAAEAATAEAAAGLGSTNDREEDEGHLRMRPPAGTQI